MKILAFTDNHGDSPAIKDDMDAVLVCGDFSNFGKDYELLFEELSATGKNIFFTSGNHESPRLCRGIGQIYGAVYLDYSWTRWNGGFIAGIGGYDIFDHDSRSRQLQEFSRWLWGLQINPAPKFSILLSHQPPAPWPYQGKECGSNEVSVAFKSWPFDLAIVGHLHEDCPRFEKTGPNHAVLNPGRCGCIIQIDVEKRNISVSPHLL